MVKKKYCLNKKCRGQWCTGQTVRVTQTVYRTNSLQDK